MNCPQDQVKLTALGGTLDDSVQIGNKVGVEGCGKRLVYVYAYGAGWVADTTQ
jgi:hypothetical protein